MTAFRIAVLAAASAPLALLAVPASAQIDDGIVLDIMRQCARIDDASARLACYDNNVRVGNSSVARPAVPGISARPLGGGAAAPNSAAAGFGREDVRGPERFEAPAGELELVTARLSSVVERNTGIYLLTLEGGAEWIFADPISLSYRVPSSGSSITIERASMGSFLMVFENQRAVRVRRVR